MNAIIPINPITSPNANAISFGEKVFRPGTNIDVAEAFKGETSVASLSATYGSGLISFFSNSTVPNLKNATKQFNTQFSLNNDKTLAANLRTLNSHVMQWASTVNKFGYTPLLNGRFKPTASQNKP